MKILSLTYEYPPIGGGGGAVAAALNRTLAASGDEVRVVTSAMKGLPEREVVDCVEILRAPCYRHARHYTTTPELATTLWPAYRVAAAAIRRNRPDLIHAHFVFPTGLVAHALSRRFGIPYVVTAHGSDIPGYNPDRFGLVHALLRLPWRRIVRQAAAVTSASEFLASMIRRCVDVPVRIVPNAYSPDAPLGRPKRNMVLVVARLFPRKGVHNFIDSLMPLQSDWEFVVAGDGPCLEALKKQARAARVKVRFTGFVDRRTLRSLYEEARIFVFPSVRENFPMVLLEAMDAGCAVITTDADGCAEAVGRAGIVTQRGDILAIRAAMISLMTDDARRDDLARRALARSEIFRWPRVAGLYRDTFASAVRDAAHVPALLDETKLGAAP
jgi:glycosyltransferase involved in cell wall biosynthesis